MNSRIQHVRGGSHACRSDAATPSTSGQHPITEAMCVWQRPLAALQAAMFSAALLLGPIQPAAAVLNSPNAQIARSVDAALRRSIPAFNPTVAGVQRNLEDVAYYLRIPQRKPWGNMQNSVQQSLESVAARGTFLEGVPAAQQDQAAQLADSIYECLKRLELAVKTQQPDAVSIRVANTLEYISALELLQAPGLPFVLPKVRSPPPPPPLTVCRTCGMHAPGGRMTMSPWAPPHQLWTPPLPKHLCT